MCAIFVGPGRPGKNWCQAAKQDMNCLDLSESDPTGTCWSAAAIQSQLSTVTFVHCTLVIFSYLYCTLGLSENWIYSPKWPVQRRSIMGSGYPGLEMDEIFDVLQCCLKIVYSRCRTSHAEKTHLWTCHMCHRSIKYRCYSKFMLILSTQINIDTNNNGY